MARRTEAKPDVGAPPPIGPEGPWPAPPEERRARRGWVALVIVLVAVAVVATAGWLVLGQPAQHHTAPPRNPAASTAATPTLATPVPATTFQAFAALSSDQQQAVMQAALDRYTAVGAEAFRTLDPSVLPQAATGDELDVLQQGLQAMIKAGYPEDDSGQDTILQVLLSPQPYSFVSVHARSEETTQYLDPKTLQPVGTPSVTSGTSTFTFVIEGGTWKVSEHIKDGP